MKPNKSAQIGALGRIGNGIKAGVGLMSKLPGAFARNLTGNDGFTKQGSSRGTSGSWSAPVKGAGQLANLGKLGK